MVMNFASHAVAARIRNEIDRVVVYTVPKLENYSEETLATQAKAVERALEEESALVTTPEEHKAFRDRWLARKNGIKTQLVEFWLKNAPPDSKKRVGILVNDLASR